MVEDVSPTMVALELSDKYGKFTIEPLERGFGQTLGNAFRRVLLAHISGAAVTDVRIDGVPHAFTTIEGVYEDATELCLNIKELAIKFDPEIVGDDEELICRIDAHGKGEITGADVICPPGIEIHNPEVHLAEITEASASLVIDMWVERNSGYHPVEEPGREKRGNDIVALDALFSPISRCMYQVEATRLGNRTDLDRLLLEVWGNGTVTPDEAIRQAARMLKQYISLFGDIEVIEEEEAEEVTGEELSNKVLGYPIEEMEFSVRTFNCLKKESVDTVGALVELSEEELLEVRNFGRRSLEEVIAKLAQHDLTLREQPASDNELVEEDDG